MIIKIGKLIFDGIEAVHLIHAIATDAGNRSMRQANRKVWNKSDYNAACRESSRLYRLAERKELPCSL